MNLPWRSSCAANRAALLDFVDRRGKGPGTDTALAHLDRCRRCEEELAEIALTIAALRRLQAELRTLEPPREAWVRVQARVGRQPAATIWRWRLTLGGSMLGTVFVVILTLPLAFGRLSAPGAPLLGEAALAPFGGSPAEGAPVMRVYDPPARSLTAELVTILAGNDRINRPRGVRALTILPAATDRAELERPPQPWTPHAEVTPPRTATRS